MFRSKSQQGNKSAKDAQNSRLAISPSGQSVPETSRLESLLDHRIRRWSQNSWCRACMSENCHLEHEDNEEIPSENNTVDEAEVFQNMLESFKEKRMAVENFLDKQEKANSASHLNSLRKPYLPSQQHLPPWLIGIIEQELTLPLVPTFPTTEEELTKLMEEMEMNHFDEGLRDDYMAAASCVRRIKVGVSYEAYPINKPIGLSFTSLPQLYIYEEISDKFNNDVYDSDTSSQDLNNGHRCPIHPNCTPSMEFGQIGDNNAVPLFNSSANLYLSSNMEAETNPAASLVSSLQQTEKCLAWRSIYRCTNGKIKESRDERVLVVGLLKSDEIDLMPFKLLLFPGERTGVASMRMTGSFLRKAEHSRYNLRWKYDVEIPAAAMETSV